MDRVEHIQEMEAHLRDSQSFFDALDKGLADFEGLAPRLEALEAYYGSPEWFDDLAAYHKGQLPEGLTYQVLSEDGVYDALVDKHRLGLALLDLARQLLA